MDGLAGVTCTLVAQDSRGVYPVTVPQGMRAVIMAPFFLSVSTRGITYIIILHRVDASVLTTQR